MVKSLRTTKTTIAIKAAFLLGTFTCACSDADTGQFESEDVSVTSEALSSGPVDVVEATYGARCRAARSNASWSVSEQCDGRGVCPYRISTSTLGDPKRGCEKDFDVRWTCGNQGAFSLHVGHEANNQTVTLACQNTMPPAFGTITVHNATYGENCGQPNGNVTWDVAPYCNGFGSCRYDIRTSFLGDPKVGCEKEFYVNYSCSNRPTLNRHLFVSREANGKTITLTCPQ